jgi:hypothetical protein
VLLACLFGLAAMGHGFALSARTRWNGLLFTLVATAVLIGLPFGALSPLAERGMRPSPLWVWLYAVPFEAMADALGEGTLWPRRPPLPLRPPWPITVSLYVLIGVVGIATTARRLRTAAQAEGQAPQATDP